MSDHPISLRELRERPSFADRKAVLAMAEVVDAAHLAYGWLPQGEPRRKLLAALAPFTFEVPA